MTHPDSSRPPVSLPDNISQHISVGNSHEQTASGHSLGPGKNWIPLRSSDGSLIFFYDPETKQLWDGGSDDEVDDSMDVEEGSREAVSLLQGPPIVEDFGDEDINAASCLIGTVSVAVFPFAGNFH